MNGVLAPSMTGRIGYIQMSVNDVPVMEPALMTNFKGLIKWIIVTDSRIARATDHRIRIKEKKFVCSQS